MNALPTRGCMTLVVMVLLFSFSFHFNLYHAQGQSLPRCPDGYQRNSDGFCFPIGILPSCPIGYQRSASGLCNPIGSTQTCSDGYQKNMFGICEPVSNCPAGYHQIPSGMYAPVKASQFVNTTASTDKNLKLSISSNFTGGPSQNSTNSTSPVKESSNATNQTQNQQVSPTLQKSPFRGLQQQGLPQQQQQLSQPQPQLYPYAPPSMQQPQQQQPLLQVPPPSSQLPFNTVPMYPYGSPSYSNPYVPPLSQQTEIPPRILSDNNYFSSTGTLHIVGEVINESFESITFVKIIATFYDSNNNVIGRI
jgi:hypothetical protein